MRSRFIKMEQTFFNKDVIELPFNEDIANKSYINSIKKFKYTMKNKSYDRTPIELFDNILMGDIAKNSFLNCLRDQGYNCVDYDEIREDNFENNDPGWDIKIGSKKVCIEVKSSIPPNEASDDEIIEKYDVKVIAGHKGQVLKSPEKIESDIHVQIYFRAKIYKKSKFSTLEDLYEFLNSNHEEGKKLINIQKFNKPLFFSWNSKEKIIFFSKTFIPNTWTFTWTSIIYWKCPIKYSHNLNKLKEIIT
jgi:hypothetical protein